MNEEKIQEFIGYFNNRTYEELKLDLNALWKLDDISLSAKLLVAKRIIINILRKEKEMCITSVNTKKEAETILEKIKSNEEYIDNVKDLILKDLLVALSEVG